MTSKVSVIYSRKWMPITFCLDRVDFDNLEFLEMALEDSDLNGPIAGVFSVKHGDVDITFTDEAHEAWYDAIIEYLKTSSPIDGVYVLCIGDLWKMSQTMSAITKYEIYDIIDYDVIRIENTLGKQAHVAVVGFVDSD